MSKITKLGMGIVAFEGCEHLKNICYEIRDQVDHILVCLQNISYHGETIDDYDKNETEHLKEIGLIDEILYYEPDLRYKDGDLDYPEFKYAFDIVEGQVRKGLNGKNADEKQVRETCVREWTKVMPRLLETQKRNMMIDHLQAAGCTQDIITDSDEFYDHDEFANAKRIFDSDDNMHVSYCQYINFYRDYNHYMLWPWDSFVPFITDIRFRFLYEKGTFNKPSDPTRRYHIPEDDECKQFHIYNWKAVHMNHFSWIRKHIEKKLDAWSSKAYFDNVPMLRNKILDRYIHFKDGDGAIITFNVPNYMAAVNKIPYNSIRPKFHLDKYITREDIADKVK